MKYADWRDESDEAPAELIQACRPPKPKTKAKPRRTTIMLPTGAVSSDHLLYIKREADAYIEVAAQQPAETVVIKAPRQMGKSSLLMRTKARLSEKGYATAAIDVAGYLGTMDDADTWYQGLLDDIADQLRLDVDVTDWWATCRAITPNQRLIQFFRDEVAAKASAPVVIFLDEIDCTLQVPYTDDFFAAIRAMYNDRASEPLFEKVAFCLVGVATPNELIKDRRTTPYNIGRTIELEDFDPTRDDLSPLFRAVSNDLATGQAVVEKVLHWTGGHPYLTVRLCWELLARRKVSPDEIDRIVGEQFADLNSLNSDVHFQYMVSFLLGERLGDALTTLGLYRRIRRGEDVPDQTSPAHIALKLAGIVKRDQRGMLVVRNRIYHRLFTDEWAASAAEAGAKQREEAAAWKALWKRDEQMLRQALGDYQLALGAYHSLRTNPLYIGDPNELWAQFFQRHALREKQREHRDAALLWQLRALVAQPTDDRARAVGELIGLDYPQLAMSFRHSSGINAIASSPDGRWAVTGSEDGTARLWQVDTGEPVGQPMRHERWINAIAFSPDGRWVVTGSADGTARLWQVDTGEPLGQPMRHERSVYAVAFSPDGRTVLAATQWWIHATQFNGEEIQPTISRRLPGAWNWGGQFHFLDPRANLIRVAVSPTSDSVSIITLRLDRPDAEPVQGDPVTLLDEWQKKLGLRINEAGEIVPMYP